MMRRAYLFVFLLSLALPLLAEDRQAIRATTTDGRQVLLQPDGTWSYVPPASPGALRFEKSEKATKEVKAPYGKFSVWIDPKAWEVSKTEQGKILLQSADGKGYALIIAEAITVPKKLLKGLALENARKMDANAQVISEEMRMVNGREVLCLQITANYNHIPLIYYSYYYSGSSGNIQVVTFTEQSQFAAKKADFTEFLNGLEVGEAPVAEAAKFPIISVNDGGIRLAYDPKKWNAPTTDKEKRINLENVKGNGWALIIPEAGMIPLDSYPEIALENAKKKDPNARIVFREKRKVHGQEVWCLKLEVTANDLPLVFYGYYYSGAGGSVQALTFTTAANFAEVEGDFTELLNSLQVVGDTSAQ